MRNVFLSYRRTDSGHVTGRLYDNLVKQLGGEHVFRDVDSIPLGIDFRRVLDEEVARCDVFIAIVGSRWLETTDPAGMRRLDDPDDFVRIEIESALARDAAILVALVDEAPPPASEQLPASLAPLANCLGLPLRPDPHFHADVAELLEAVRNAKVAPRRVVSTSERWFQALDVASRRALWGNLAGIAIGGAVAGGYMLMHRMFPERGGNYGELLSIIIPGTIGATILFTRHLGARGLLLGPIAGPVLSITILLGMYLLFALPCLVLQSFVGSLGLLAFDRSTAIISGMMGTIFALPTTLFVARAQARRRARRQRVRVPLLGLLGGILGGGVIGSLVGTILFQLLRVPANPWSTLPIGFLLTTVLFTSLFAALDGLFGRWRNRSPGKTNVPAAVRSNVDNSD